MPLIDRQLWRTLRAPFDRSAALRRLRTFHRHPRSLEEIVDWAMAFGGRGHFRITTTQKRSEILGLARRVARLKPKTILEIGTARGGTAFIWAQLASRRVVTCDIEDRTRQAEVYRRFPPPHSKCELVTLQGDSHARHFARRVAELFPQGVDFLFIDGDHTLDGVTRDYELYRPLVRPGGLIAFHDIVEDQPLPENQVFQFWKTLKETVPHEELIDSPQQCGFGIGVVRAAA